MEFEGSEFFFPLDGAEDSDRVTAKGERKD
jgi:hypothetical protein